MDCLPQVHTIAIHAPYIHPLRTFVPGLGVLCHTGDYLAGAGAYSNSDGRLSTYAMGGWQPWQPINDLKVGLFGGAVTGYGRPVNPLGGAFISYKHLHLTLVPPVRNMTPLLGQFSFTF